VLCTNPSGLCHLFPFRPSPPSTRGQLFLTFVQQPLSLTTSMVSSSLIYLPFPYLLQWPDIIELSGSSDEDKPQQQHPIPRPSQTQLPICQTSVDKTNLRPARQLIQALTEVSYQLSHHLSLISLQYLDMSQPPLLADPAKQPSQNSFYATTATTFQNFGNCLNLHEVERLQSGQWITDATFTHYAIDVRIESLEPQYSETARYLHCVEPSWIRKFAVAHSYQAESKRPLKFLVSATSHLQMQY
jgi:hypothetical protein